MRSAVKPSLHLVEFGVAHPQEDPNDVTGFWSAVGTINGCCSEGLVMLLVFVLGIRIVAATHGYLARYAPSNVVIDHARTAPHRCGGGGRWPGLACCGTAAGVRLFFGPLEASAPAWLNVGVLVGGVYGVVPHRFTYV